MTVAAILLVYAASVGTVGSRMLGRARWAARAPLLGIVIYLAAAWSVLAALGLAGLTLAVHATALGGVLSYLIGACVLRLRDAYATPGGAIVAGLGLTLAGAVIARAAVTAVTHLRAVRQHAPRRVIDWVVANRQPISPEVAKRYRAQGAEPVAVDLGDLQKMGYRVVLDNLLDEHGVIRHNSARLAQLLFDEFLSRRPSSVPAAK